MRPLQKVQFPNPVLLSEAKEAQLRRHFHSQVQHGNEEKCASVLLSEAKDQFGRFREKRSELILRFAQEDWYTSLVTLWLDARPRLRHRGPMALRLQQRADSFRHALRGIGLVLRTQPNAWIHLAATVAVTVAGWLLHVTRGEWLALILAIGLVWTAEALNTAIEFLADEISRQRNERLGFAKDTGAAGVLLASIAAALIGLLIFVPHALALLER